MDYIIPSSRSLIYSSVLSFLLFIPSSVFLLSLIIFFSSDRVFLIFSNLDEVLTVFFHSYPEFVEHFNDHHFEFLIKYVSYISFIKLFFSCEVLSYSFIWNKIYCLLICLTFCVYFYELDKKATSPNLNCGLILECCLCRLLVEAGFSKPAGPAVATGWGKGCSGMCCVMTTKIVTLKSTNQRVSPLEVVI